MKKLQQLLLAGVFALAFTTSIFAGDIDTGGKTAPPPPSLSATTSVKGPIDGEVDADYKYQLIEDIVLDLFHTMLSAF